MLEKYVVRSGNCKHVYVFDFITFYVQRLHTDTTNRSVRKEKGQNVIPKSDKKEAWKNNEGKC